MADPVALGIDIGGTHLRAARVRGAKIEALAKSASSHEPRDVLARCLALVDEVRGPEATAIGIGIPGQVDAEARRAISGGFVDLSGFDIFAEVEAATGLPVVVENDATMALIGEAAFGAARGWRNAVMLTIGTGIGGAIFERGQVLRGARAAGQLGHIVVEPDGRPCLCGRVGCVETTSSGTALGRLIAGAGLPADTRVEDLLARDDAQARAIISAWAGPLRRAIDSLISVLNPDIVVIGGGLGPAAVAGLETVPEAKGWYHAPVRAATLGDGAGVIGAARAALTGGAAAKRVVLVNGVPASGKSAVAHALAAATGWPILALDTIKAPFLAALPPATGCSTARSDAQATRRSSTPSPRPRPGPPSSSMPGSASSRWKCSTPGSPGPAPGNAPSSGATPRRKPSARATVPASRPGPVATPAPTTCPNS